MANGVGLRLQSLRGSRVRIPPPAPISNLCPADPVPALLHSLALGDLLLHRLVVSRDLLGVCRGDK